MSDNEEEEETGPAVELGDGPLVEGAPLARVASRLTWPIERSRLLEREGDSVVRTPDGPRELSALIDEVDVTYFDTRQTFLERVRAAVGEGPVETAGPAPDAGDEGGAGDDADGEASTESAAADTDTDGESGDEA